MIQLNLLPDIKLDYIKTKRTKRMVTLIASGVATISLGLLIILFVVVNILQKQHISNLTEDIAANSQTLQSTPDLNKVLTIQNQLNALPGLHGQKAETTRLFGYLKQVVPNNVSISQLDLDVANGTLIFTGSAPDIQDVNTFVDTLKFTTYTVEGAEAKKAFPEVVLTSFSRDEKSTTYQISGKFDPTIFNNAQKVELIVPKTVTTRSQTEKPAALFEQGGN
jgi:Tfp pilus assembly protein PilN